MIRHGIRIERSPIEATTRGIENEPIRKGWIDGVLIGKTDVAFGEDRNQRIDDDSGFRDQKGQRVLRGVDRLRLGLTRIFDGHHLTGSGTFKATALLARHQDQQTQYRQKTHDP